MMSHKNLGRTLVAASAFVALGSYAASHAGGMMKPNDMLKMEMVDTNKDGVVTREEFLAAMGKVFDMKAKEMNAKDGKLDAGQLDTMRRAMFQQ